MFSSVKRHLSIFISLDSIHIGPCRPNGRHLRLCVSKEIKATILTAGTVRVTHSVSDTVSLGTSHSRALSTKWGSCQDRHSDHYKYHLFIRKYLAGVVLCRSITWCGDSDGVGHVLFDMNIMLFGVSMVSRLKWTRHVSIYTSSCKNKRLSGLASRAKIHKIKTKQINHIQGPSFLKTFSGKALVKSVLLISSSTCKPSLDTYH